MKSKFINVLMFATGAAVGSFVTWKIAKTKYEQIVQAELQSIREAFGETEGEQEEIVEDDEEEDRAGCQGQINWDELEDLDEEEEEFDTETIKEYHNIAGTYSNEEGGAEKVAKRPYVIAPYDFGELDDYHTLELTYYADGVVEDDSDGSVLTNEEIEKYIGADSLFTFGEYEEDSVYVRNENLRTDFVILRDSEEYDKARRIGPGRVDN